MYQSRRTIWSVPSKQEPNRLVEQQLDHAFVMHRTPAGEAFAEALGTRFERIVCVDYQPTCENMLADFAARIAPRLPEGVELYALRLHETATSYAEWVADDNN